MKYTKLAIVCLFSVAGAVTAADRKEPAKVDTNALMKETQYNRLTTTSDGRQGMHFAWYLPVEFWQASLLSNPQLSKAQADAVIEQMKGLLILPIVRSEIEPGGAFDFVEEAAVRNNLSLKYTAADGKVVDLKEKTDIPAPAAAILASMKPMLRASMGNMGQNMHFLVFNDSDANGQRIVVPDAPGKLSITLAPVPAEAGGTVEFKFPLNSLFEPRECTKCHEGGQLIQWQYCPHCGNKLEK